MKFGLLKRIACVFMTMAFAGGLTAVVSAEENSKSTVFVVGDSTACEYGYDNNYIIPRAGWGMYLDEFLNDNADVVDLALSGRSSKSFTVEDNYKTLLSSMKEGDFVLIQFGHNDAKQSSEEDKANRYTSAEGDKDTAGTFKNSLYVNYIKPAMEAGATPVLLTPISRHSFDDQGNVEDTHGLYDDAVLELAEELDLDCIDMTSITAQLYNDLGADMAIVYHAVFRDTSKGTDGYDTTHLNHFGGANIARNVAYNMYDIDSTKNLVDIENVNNDDLYCLGQITRAEFVAELVRLTGRDVIMDDEGKYQLVEFAPDFNDVAADSEYASALGLAKELGIARGDDKGNFNGDSLLTMQDMCVLVSNMFSISGRPLKDNVLVRDVTVENVSDYAKSSVTGVLNSFYASGDTFCGTDLADRSTCFYLYDIIFDMLYEPQADAEAESADQLEIVEK